MKLPIKNALLVTSLVLSLFGCGADKYEQNSSPKMSNTQIVEALWGKSFANFSCKGDKEYTHANGSLKTDCAVRDDLGKLLGTCVIYTYEPLNHLMIYANRGSIQINSKSYDLRKVWNFNISGLGVIYDLKEEMVKECYLPLID